jgi:hypothetical protein
MGEKNAFPVLQCARPRTIQRIVWSVLGFLAFVSAMAVAIPAAAQDDAFPKIKLTARAGYDGYYKNDFWVPVRVSVSNDGPAVQGYLQIVTGDAGGNDRVVYRSPISLPTSSNKGQTLYVHLSNFASELVVELIDASDDVIVSAETNRLTGLATDSLLYAVVTRVPGRLGYLEDVMGGRSEAAVAYLSLAELPDVPAALNALDVVIFDDVDTGQLAIGQREALESWLDTGGTLVFTGGVDWQETTAGLDELLPVAISGTRSLEDIPALRDFSSASFRDPGPYLVADSDLQRGEILLHQDDVPLLARRGHGRGSVFFLALDPSLAPLLDWEGSKAVWGEIVDYAQPLPEWANGARQSYAATSAVSSLPATDLPSGWALFVFLVFYVIVVGPLNYLVLRRLGRRELAWFTIPLLVIIFSTSAYLVGFQLKGNETIINQMSIVYGQAEGEQARVQTLIGIYSPRRATYDLSLPPEAIPRPFERIYGGLSGPGNIGAIEQAQEMVVTDVRVDVGGVETLVADSYQPRPNVTGSVRIRPADGSIVLEIDLFNHGSFTLENATLLVGSRAIALGDLAAGSSILHSEEVLSPETPAAGTGPIGVYVPTPPTMSPLLANLDTILGSTDYYNDREVYPRWQLLQAMAPDYAVNMGASAPSAFTLVAWSKQPQLDLSLRDETYSATATSLYLLELPASRQYPRGAEMILPREFLNWTVLAEDGVYDVRIDDLYLAEGSIEFEFNPWPDFQLMKVQGLSIIMQPPNGSPTPPLPRVRLWDWDLESWRTPGDPVWGQIAVEDPSHYVGPGNVVRLQLINPGPEGIMIQRIYPELVGTMEE